MTAQPSDGVYPDPRLLPWPAFALAASAAVEHLHDLVGLDLWVVTALEGTQQKVVASAGPWASACPPGTTSSWEDSFCLRMVSRQGPVVAPDISCVPAYAQVAVGPLSAVRAYVGAPLQGEDGGVLGTLCGFAGQPQPQELSSSAGPVRLVGRMLSTILAREQLARDRSQEAAAAHALVERDRVTGLRNARGWRTALEHEDTRCQRYGGTVSLLALDLDLPERDGPGEEALLADCSQVLARSCRPGDVLARVGATEFAVVALECDPAAARALLTRLRVALRTEGISASTGAATRRIGERLPEAWVRATQDASRDRRRRGSPVPRRP